MRSANSLVFLAALPLLASQPALADDEVNALGPASPWVMDYAADSCSLRREFGTGDDRVILKLEQFAPDRDEMQITVAGPNMRWRNPNAPGSPTIRFIPDVEPIETGTPLNVAMADDWKGIVFFSSLMIAPATASGLEGGALQAFLAGFDRPARERGITAIEIRNGLVDDLQLQTGSLASPMGAMRTCLDELVTHWGLDAEVQRTLRQRVEPLDFDTWGTAIWRSYPRAMWQRGQQALLRIRLSITAEGDPSGCFTQLRVGEEDFERRACEILMARARFSPAIDAQGNAIASYYLMILSYRQSGPI